MDLVSSPAAMRRWALASLIGNMGIVVTGGLVRVTGSGLGCSTWPQCTPGSYVPHAESGAHAFIEFGNRTLTFVLVAIAIGTFVAAWRARDAVGSPRRDLRGLALAAALGIPAQAVIGGISVLTGLNPWVVGLHLVPSIALIVISTVLVHQAWRVVPAPVPARARLVVVATFVVGLVAMLAGMVVTGAGPNSGDGGAARNGLDLTTVARVHSLSVWVVVALTIVLLALLRRVPGARRAVQLLLVVELAQGAVGYAQYFLALPAALVALHMVGTTLFTAALTHLWWLTRTPAASAEAVETGAATTH
ncbi:MAG: COX15/CtaA family protein [Propionicimonas sp.]|uniref:COX15/CtaA family protein n=1 Tax=Propionicimonas sp. TaxID=1955623 RepID=UPI003D0FF7DF